MTGEQNKTMRGFLMIPLKILCGDFMVRSKLTEQKASVFTAPPLQNVAIKNLLSDSQFMKRAHMT